MRTYARVAGALYLVIIVCAGFSEGFVRSSLIVPGDAAATAGNILESPGLFRLGFAGDLIAFLADAAVAVLLYVLLKPVSQTMSLLAAAFRLLAHPAIAAVNLLNHFGVLLILGGSEYLTAFQPEQLNAMAMLSLETHRYGYLIGGAFFGVHCGLLAYLVIKSRLFPSVLGVLLYAASFGYLTESFAFFLFPSLEALASSLVVVTAGIAEVSLCLWLLVKGVREAPGELAAG